MDATLLDATMITGAAPAALDASAWLTLLGQSAPGPTGSAAGTGGAGGGAGPTDAWTTVIGFTALATALAAALAAVLQRAGLPGAHRRDAASAAVVGGVLAGLLLGPMVAGGLAPEAWRAAVLGGEAERQALRDLAAEQDRATAALRQTGVSPVALEELADRQDAQRDAARTALETARLEHAERSTIAAAVLAGVMALAGVAGLVAGLRSRPRGAQTGRARPLAGWRRPGLGVAALLLSAAPAGLVLALLLRGSFSWQLLALAALAMAIPGMSAALMKRDAGVGWARLLSVLALVGVGLAIDPLGADPWRLWFASIVAVGGITGFAAGLAVGPGLRSGAAATGLRLAAGVGLAGLTAVLVARVDPGAAVRSGTFWIAAIVALIASDDGRLLGIWAAIRGMGTPRQRATPWAAANRWIAGAGPAQIVAASFALLGLLTDPAGDVAALALALVIGVTTLELTAQLRTSVAGMLDRAGADAGDADG